MIQKFAECTESDIKEWFGRNLSLVEILSEFQNDPKVGDVTPGNVKELLNSFDIYFDDYPKVVRVWRELYDSSDDIHAIFPDAPKSMDEIFQRTAERLDADIMESLHETEGLLLLAQAFMESAEYDNPMEAAQCCSILDEIQEYFDRRKPKL